MLPYVALYSKNQCLALYASDGNLNASVEILLIYNFTCQCLWRARYNVLLLFVIIHYSLQDRGSDLM